MITGTRTILMLFESELRAAASALDRVVQIAHSCSPENATPELMTEYNQAVTSALNACIVALHGVATTPTGHIMVSAADHLLDNQSTVAAPKLSEV